ncbi:MAG: MFS transporter, partial [Bdellovibrionaceae bacterium]|nr:MFS transporter [Pseudobdellovibrionaceae bacterium]
MYLAAFPKIAADFNTTTSRVALSLSSYFVGLAVGQIFYGPFLDRFGRKRPIYFGLGIYILASIACMYAQNIDQLITIRFFQAIGGCAASVASTAMVRDFFSPKDG